MNRRLAITTLTIVLSTVCAWAQEPQDVPSARVPKPSPSATAEELVERAETLHVEKDYLDALDYYRAAIAKQNSSVTWNRMGITLLQMGRDDDARKSFEKAVKLDKA